MMATKMLSINGSNRCSNHPSPHHPQRTDCHLDNRRNTDAEQLLDNDDEQLQFVLQPVLPALPSAQLSVRHRQLHHLHHPRQAAVTPQKFTRSAAPSAFTSVAAETRPEDSTATATTFEFDGVSTTKLRGIMTRSFHSGKQQQQQLVSDGWHIGGYDASSTASHPLFSSPTPPPQQSAAGYPVATTATNSTINAVAAAVVATKTIPDATMMIGSSRQPVAVTTQFQWTQQQPIKRLPAPPPAILSANRPIGNLTQIDESSDEEDDDDEIQQRRKHRNRRSDSTTSSDSYSSDDSDDADGDGCEEERNQTTAATANDQSRKRASIQTDQIQPQTVQKFISPCFKVNNATSTSTNAITSTPKTGTTAVNKCKVPPSAAANIDSVIDEASLQSKQQTSSTDDGDVVSTTLLKLVVEQNEAMKNLQRQITNVTKERNKYRRLARRFYQRLEYVDAPSTSMCCPSPPDSPPAVGATTSAATPSSPSHCAGSSPPTTTERILRHNNERTAQVRRLDVQSSTSSSSTSSSNGSFRSFRLQLPSPSNNNNLSFAEMLSDDVKHAAIIEELAQNILNDGGSGGVIQKHALAEFAAELECRTAKASKLKATVESLTNALAQERRKVACLTGELAQNKEMVATLRVGFDRAVLRMTTLESLLQLAESDQRLLIAQCRSAGIGNSGGGGGRRNSDEILAAASARRAAEKSAAQLLDQVSWQPEHFNQLRQMNSQLQQELTDLQVTLECLDPAVFESAVEAAVAMATPPTSDNATTAATDMDTTASNDIFEAEFASLKEQRAELRCQVVCLEKEKRRFECDLEKTRNELIMERRKYGTNNTVPSSGSSPTNSSSINDELSEALRMSEQREQRLRLRISDLVAMISALGGGGCSAVKPNDDFGSMTPPSQPSMIRTGMMTSSIKGKYDIHSRTEIHDPTSLSSCNSSSAC